MNKYVRKLFGVVFQSQQTQQIFPVPLQPSPTSPEGWRAYWQAKGLPWRTEPEIDANRQEELSKRRAIIPDLEKGIYPFKGMKLSRADVEWLLATHENGCGPVDWSDESQLKREGLDLRGVDLRHANLHHLPLTRLHGGLTFDEDVATTLEQGAMAAVLMGGSDLTRAQLQGANLRWAQLQGANLYRAQLQETDLRWAQLQGANLVGAQMQKVDLYRAQLQETDLRGAELQGVDLRHVVLGNEQHIGPRVSDVKWGDTNFAVVDWSQVAMLGDEHVALQKKTHGRKKIDKGTRFDEDLRAERAAVRATRQLAVALQNQGLNEEATRFAYRAQILQRKLFWFQRDIGKWFFSFLLALLAGYGYRMWRIFAAYLIVVSLCAVAYFFIGMYHPPHLTLLQAFLESIMAFHGRVFYELFTPDTPQIWVTAFEAVAGLVIEGVFIAMLAQRFFGK